MYEYSAVVVREIDGDTFTIDADLGLRVHITIPVRLYGLDTPERGQPGHDEAQAFLTALLPVGTEIVVRTHAPASRAGLEKYGRWLASVSTPTCVDVAQAVIDAGLGRFYDGGTKGVPA